MDDGEDKEPKLLSPPGSRDLHTPPIPARLPNITLQSPANTEHKRQGGLLRVRDERSATELPEFPSNVHDWEEGRDGGDGDGEGDGNGNGDGTAGAGQHSLRSQAYSEATTAEDSVRVFNRYRLVRQTPKWYDSALRWWRREISVKVDASKRRDHLGMSLITTCILPSSQIHPIKYNYRINKTHSQPLNEPT
jgi:hypothetical protein